MVVTQFQTVSGVDFGIFVNSDGYAEVVWTNDEGKQSAELDPNSADVKEALALIRKVIWGN